MNKGDKVELKAEAPCSGAYDPEPQVPELDRTKSGSAYAPHQDRTNMEKVRVPPDLSISLLTSMAIVVSLLQPFHVVPLILPYVISSHDLVYQFL
jgi:hypothetical protein